MNQGPRVNAFGIVLLGFVGILGVGGLGGCDGRIHHVTEHQASVWIDSRLTVGSSHPDSYTGTHDWRLPVLESGTDIVLAASWITYEQPVRTTAGPWGEGWFIAIPDTATTGDAYLVGLGATAMLHRGGQSSNFQSSMPPDEDVAGSVRILARDEGRIVATLDLVAAEDPVGGWPAAQLRETIEFTAPERPEPSGTLDP